MRSLPQHSADWATLSCPTIYVGVYVGMHGLPARTRKFIARRFGRFSGSEPNFIALHNRLARGAIHRIIFTAAAGGEKIFRRIDFRSPILGVNDPGRLILSRRCIFVRIFYLYAPGL